MPQEFHVVRCFNCETFQVHIIKKVPKWECKLCGEKQSLKKEYGKGTAKDCRLHVQKLNTLRSESISNDEGDQYDSSNHYLETDEKANSLISNNVISKWSEFLDDDKK